MLLLIRQGSVRGEWKREQGWGLGQEGAQAAVALPAGWGSRLHTIAHIPLPSVASTTQGPALYFENEEGISPVVARYLKKVECQRQQRLRAAAEHADCICAADLDMCGLCPDDNEAMGK